MRHARRPALVALLVLVCLAGASSSRAALGTTFTVTTTADSGVGSLRQAILDANATSAADAIHFAIGSGAQTIQPATALPAITAPVTIDGTTQGDTSGGPLITISGASAIQTFVCLDLEGKGASGSTINAVKVVDCSFGIELGAKSQGSTVTGVWAAVNYVGVAIDGSSKNTVSQSTLSGNVLHGVVVQDNGSSNTIIGNHVGTNLAGTAASPNGQIGVGLLGGTKNLVVSNVISGNSGHGVEIDYQGGNTIQGNYIGTNPAGTSAIANANGVLVTTAKNTIRDNVISGNTSRGIEVSGDSNVLVGNEIGTQVGGAAALGNGSYGVELTGTKNQVGVPGQAPNVISANFIGIEVETTGNLVQNNLIGTDATGAAAIGNAHQGIMTLVPMTIGGTKAGQGNVVSGNLGTGIALQTAGAKVIGNYVGTSVDGTAALGNAEEGVWMSGNTNTITGNLISGNGSSGIFYSGNGNVVQGNRIGTNALNTGTIPNADTGINVDGAQGGLIGGTKKGAGNIIRGNMHRGIGFGDAAATGVSILGNSFADNGDLGIDLGYNGVTANDAGDGDTGWNNYQNWPTVTGAVTAGTSVVVSGTLGSMPSRSYRIEIFAAATCDPSGNGEGLYLTGATVKTDMSGNASFAIKVSPGAAHYSATATDLVTGDTSEFGNCFP